MSDSRSDRFSPDADGLLAILRRLRAPDGCPWDRKQTRQSLIRHLDGECAELIDAIMREDVPNIREELGDVLMNLLFQVAIAEEKGEFTLTDVWREINEKMVRRHAHVFGDAHADTAEDVTALWQKVKAAESGHADRPASRLDDVKPTLCPLDRAERLQKKAAEAHFDWSETSQVVDKVAEELDEVRSALASGDGEHADEELGDLLFAVVNLIRFRSRRSAVETMRRSNAKFEERFRRMETLAAAKNLVFEELTPAEMDDLWEQVKRQPSASDGGKQGE